jgi:predicted GIY-YIG superfamily endonuclease
LAKEGLTNKIILTSYHPKKMNYTYIIKSIFHPNQSYFGFTSNLKQRLEDHNSGKSPHTIKYKPWKLEFYCAFNSKKKAINFEKYLKSGSGRSFTKKHF